MRSKIHRRFLDCFIESVQPVPNYQCSSVALKDYNGDGVPETTAVLKEGELAYISVEVNTPHTQALTIRIEFKGLPPNSLAISGPGVTSAGLDSNIAYLTIPATVDQANPMTAVTFAVTPHPDANAAAEVITLDLVAGARDGLAFSAYPNFTPVANRTLFLLDRDTPASPVGATLYGSDVHDLDHGPDPGGSPYYYGTGYDASIDLAGGGWARIGWSLSPATNEGRPIPGDILADARLTEGAYNSLTPLDPSARELVARYGKYAAVYGLGGDDLLYGRADGTPTRLDGGDGSDVIFAQEGGYTTSVLIPDQPGAVVDGGAGHDAILGGWANDWITAGAGHDQAFGQAGDDYIDGGSGNDWLSGETAILPTVDGAGTEASAGSSGYEALGYENRDVIIGAMAAPISIYRPSAA